VKRSIGITILALVLAWLGLGGFALGLMSPALAKLGLPWMLYRFAGFIYGASALLAAIGMWRVAPWSYRAFQLWIVAALAGGSLPALTMQATAPSRWVLPLGWLVLLALLLPLARYVRRSVPVNVSAEG